MDEHSISTLRTGERVISEPLPGVRSVAIGFWIGSGARDETPSRAGVSHFIEHLLFKGSSRYSAQRIAESFDSFGSELNAATSRETTLVYARVPDERLATAVEIMADMIFSPQFADLDSEREVVLEEIAMVDDTPGDLVHDLLGEAVFGTHPLGRPVLGAAEVIRTVSRRSLAAFHRRAYGPENVVLAAAGSVDHGALTALLERALDDRSPAAAAPPARRQAPPAQRARFRFDEKDTEQYHVCLGAPGIARDDPRRFTLSLLDTILGGSASSRLFQEIREKRGMAYSVYSFTSQLSDSGEIGVYLGTREENLVEALEITVAEIVALAAGELRAGELERAKDNLKGRIMLSLESTSSRMSRLGKSLVTGIELIELDRVIAAIDAVGPEDVAELAHALLAPERLSAAGIGPSEERFLEAVGRVNPDLAARAA